MAEKIDNTGISMDQLNKLRAAVTRKLARQEAALQTTRDEISAYDQLIRQKIQQK